MDNWVMPQKWKKIEQSHLINLYVLDHFLYILFHQINVHFRFSFLIRMKKNFEILDLIVNDWKKRSLELEQIIYDINIKVNTTVILRELGKWNTGFRREELRNKSKKLFFGHHLNSSCSGSTSKNTSVLMTQFNMTRMKAFTLLASMWPMKKNKEIFR